MNCSCSRGKKNISSQQKLKQLFNMQMNKQFFAAIIIIITLTASISINSRFRLEKLLNNNAQILAEIANVDDLYQRRISRMKTACETLRKPVGYRTLSASRTSVIKDLDLSYCQVTKTSSSAITNQLLQALIRRGRQDVKWKVRNCESMAVQTGRKCNYHSLLRQGVG